MNQNKAKQIIIKLNKEEFYMKISKLSFKTRQIDLGQGDGLGKYLAFYFYVDGKQIGKNEYNPTSFMDILNSYSYQIFIQHCSSGYTGASALVGKVIGLDDLIEWKISEYHNDSDEEVYYFDKAEYEKIMAQVYNAAYLEEINAIADNKTLFLKMELDGGGLFWKQDRTCIGNVETLTLDDSKDIKLNVDGLQQWANNYMCNVLVPSESGEITIEQINKTFNWKLFHRQGIELAVEVKKLLPKNVFLKYVTPFEDESNLIPKEILIREDRWYVRNILEKLICFLNF